ncbi:hypothetical protein ACQEVB_04100 [Pseudonocardia sp. CA-107938]|uniref:hypothetical protein n=1 Tax=Pseudonocardia sp. CA-107938 TaxID=3240021 RepID=UPI003D8A49B7
MRRLLAYAAATAVLVAPWLVQGLQPAPTGSATVAICRDDGNVAPVAHVQPLGADRPTGSLVIACGGSGGGGGGGTGGGCRPGRGACGRS